MFRRIVLTFVSLLLCVGYAAAQSLPARTAWLNQRGSYLFVNAIDATGKFKGTYYNNAAGTKCRGTAYDVSGLARGADVTFVVTWKNSKEDCNTVTAWRGTISGRTIYTTWQLAYADPNTGLVQVLNDSDVFQQADFDVIRNKKRLRPR